MRFMLSDRNHWRFYSRNSAGVYAMNATELRTAFLLSDTLSQRLTDFRERRLHEIVTNRQEILVDRDWSGTVAGQDEVERKSLLVIHLQPSTGHCAAVCRCRSK